LGRHRKEIAGILKNDWERLTVDDGNFFIRMRRKTSQKKSRLLRRDWSKVESDVMVEIIVG
jgi:hypothetical protein